MREALIAEQRALAPWGKPATHCVDCGNEIPLERQQAAPGLRCTHCQSAIERRGGSR
ncbi:TraR/DksA C4-type zinc finger protein [uncultured Aquitalea sp.]